MGVLYVGEDFELVCWDVVSDPSTPGAWIDEEPENLKQYVESKEINSKKSNLFEKLEKFNEWLDD